MASGSGAAGPSSSSAPIPGPGVGGAAVAAVDAVLLAAAEEYLLNNQDEGVQQNEYSSQELDAYVADLQAELPVFPAELDNFDDVLNMNVNQIVMTPDEMDQTVAYMEELNIMMAGHFVLRVLNDLLNAGRWLNVIQYLENCVTNHAQASVVPAPADASTAALVRIHGELFLYLHRQYVWELLENGNREVAQKHFIDHVWPLAQSVPPGSRLAGLFNSLWINIVQNVNRPQDLNVAAQTTSTEVRDYMFLYFPAFRPRGDRERSPLWAFGEKIQAENGTTGFRCYSCHRVYNNVKPIRLSMHLLGGNHQQGMAPCPAVLPCTLQRLALIPHGQQQQAQAAAAAALAQQGQHLQEAAAAAAGGAPGQEAQDAAAQVQEAAAGGAADAGEAQHAAGQQHQ